MPQPSGQNSLKRVSFDTNVIVWGLELKGAEDRPEMVFKAKALIDKLSEEGCPLVVSVIVVEEFLRTYQPVLMGAVCSILGERFHIAEYNLKTAMRAATIFQNEARPILQELQDDGKSKQEIYDDIKIVSCALEEGVSVLYSEDHALGRIGTSAGLNVQKLPRAQGKLPYKTQRETPPT